MDQPDKVDDDEQLNDAVDDPDRPALHHHRLGGLVGEEVSHTAPHHRGHPAHDGARGDLNLLSTSQ